jgi:hypothetical protein
MKKFPLDLIKPVVALLSGEPDCASVEIILKSFFLDGKLVETSIRLDGVEIPSIRLADLANKSFVFPINPSDGYIDGSIYIDGAHHPVDVTALSFHLGRDGLSKIVVKGFFDFEQEGLKDYEKTPFTISVLVATCAI